MSFVIVIYCEAQVSATGRSLIQKSPTDCRVYCLCSRNLNNEAALVRDGLLRHRKREKRIASLIPNLDIRYRRVVSFMPWPPYPQGRAPVTHRIRGQLGPSVSFDALEQDIRFASARKLNTIFAHSRT